MGVGVASVSVVVNVGRLFVRFGDELLQADQRGDDQGELADHQGGGGHDGDQFQFQGDQNGGGGGQSDAEVLSDLLLLLPGLCNAKFMISSV